MIDQFGGVAITLPRRTEINAYSGFAGKHIVIPSKSSLGGWQVHLREAITQGVDLREVASVTELKNHRKVVQAILRGEADAGFVRSDLIEGMVKKGELQFNQVRVVNPVKQGSYPYLLSTRLYPEWPFAMVGEIPHKIAVKVLHTLIEMPHNEEAAIVAGIAGWTIPGNYSTVVDLFQEAGLGPYAPTPPTFLETLNRYWVELLTTTLAISLLLFLMSMRVIHINRLLRSNEKRLQQAANVFKFADEGVIITDASARIIDVNEAFCKTTGYSKREVIGKNPNILQSGKQSRPFYQQMWKTLQQKGKWSGSLWNKKKSGELFAEQLTIVAIHNQQGVIEQYVAVFKDLTEQLESDKKLKQAMAAKDEFLASMSHELRTPLTSILGNSELLLDSGIYGNEECLQKDAEEVITAIQVAGRTQLALVNDILDMSRIESGKFLVDKIPYSLNNLLRDVEQVMSVKAQDTTSELTFEQKNREEYLLVGDPQRIAQILINLIDNAIKFTEKGSISLTTHSTDKHLLFTVKDTGIGMPPEVVENLFSRFEQADGSISRRFGGSGLGLFISLSLAELMDGTIHASSEENVGSTFELILPYRQSDTPVNNKLKKQSESALNEKLKGHVLVAEDTPLLQQLERRMLEKVGLTVTLAKDGQEAVELAGNEHFDLILMDMQMPVMDGIEATQKIKQSGNQTPIIAVTANVMQKHRDAFNEAGCSDFVGKPFDEQGLKRVLKKYL